MRSNTGEESELSDRDDNAAKIKKRSGNAINAHTIRLITLPSA